MMVAPACSAIRRWMSGGMIRSSVPITVQLGSVFQAEVVDPMGSRPG